MLLTLNWILWFLQTSTTLKTNQNISKNISKHSPELLKSDLLEAPKINQKQIRKFDDPESISGEILIESSLVCRQLSSELENYSQSGVFVAVVSPQMNWNLSTKTSLNENRWKIIKIKVSSMKMHQDISQNVSLCHFSSYC